MGIDASKSTYRNRATIQARRNQLRSLLCETLERRELMAIDGPRLLSIAPNSGEIFSTTSPNTLDESPRELVLRFDSAIAPATLQNGIRISRSGGDGVLGARADPEQPAVKHASCGWAASDGEAARGGMLV